VNEKAQKDAIEQLCLNSLFNPNSVLVVTAFDSVNEIEMKNYLLKPKKRLQICGGKVWLVKGGLLNAWQFIKDKHFFCAHFKYDP